MGVPLDTNKQRDSFPSRTVFSVQTTQKQNKLKFSNNRAKFERIESMIQICALPEILDELDWFIIMNELERVRILLIKSGIIDELQVLPAILHI